MDFCNITLAIIRDGGIAAVVIFLGRSYIKHSFDRDLAKFRADLEHSAREHQVSFSHIYAKRAEIIADLYRKIVELDHAIFRLCGAEFPEIGTKTPIEDVKSERHDQVLNAFIKLHTAFDYNRLYLSDEIDLKLKDLDEVVWNVFTEAGWEIGNPGGIDWKQFNKLRGEWKSDKVADLKKDIKNEFRRLLKVD